MKPNSSNGIQAELLNSILASVLLSIVIVSCSAKIPYAADYPLSEEVFRFRDSNLSGRIPSGWFVSGDDTLAPSLSVWLVQNDLSATLVIRELLLDSLTAHRVRRDGLKLLAAASAAYQSGDISPAGENLKEFSLGRIKCCSYETGADNNRKRIVVFSALGKYYECEIRILGNEWDTENIKRLISVQQTVLSSLTY